jgi:diaminopimelate decarboxylase
MSGKPTQFGIDETQIGEARLLLDSCNYLECVGMHVYMGTRFLEVPAISENTRKIFELALRVEDALGKKLAFVDVGGGFGVTYFERETDLDLKALGAAMTNIVDCFKRSHPSTKVIIELGRFLVAPSGVFVTAVRYVKRSKGKLFAVCDGGSNCHSGAAGFGSAFRRNFPISNLSGTSSNTSVYTLAGPLCTPTDVIGEDVVLSEIDVGDLIGIFQSGAYGPTASPVHFLGYGHPAEVMVDGDEVFLIRDRDNTAEVLARQISIPITCMPLP